MKDLARQPDGSGLVALDAGPARHPSTGVSVYVEELSRGLEALVPHRIVRIGVRRGGPLPPADGDAGETVLTGRLHLAWLQTRADREARAAGCGLAHYTNAVAPLRARVPFVLSIHDLSLLRHPRQHPRRRWAAVPLVVASARRARLVIVPSEATAQGVRRLLHVARERITVIPLAARHQPDRPVDRRLLESLEIAPGRFILSVGTIEPRKNHARLLAAFERVAERDPHLRLVLVGSRGWRSGGFERSLARSAVRDRVVVAGHQPDDALATLFATCSVMAYPSTHEGFGLPVIEAMAAGAPVVTSNLSSLPEVAGGAAVLVDPYDVASIARGLVEAMGRREELIAGGLARALTRDWSDVAAETADVYDRAGRSRQ